MPKIRTKKGADPVAVGSVPPPKRPSVSLPTPAGYGRARDVLDCVKSVKTIFPDFNRATRVGGLPVNRMHTIHGPTHGGKSAFVIGLLRSLLDGGHAAGYTDAEHSTPQEFVLELMTKL